MPEELIMAVNTVVGALTMPLLKAIKKKFNIESPLVKLIAVFIIATLSAFGLNWAYSYMQVSTDLLKLGMNIALGAVAMKAIDKTYNGGK